MNGLVERCERARGSAGWCSSDTPGGLSDATRFTDCVRAAFDAGLEQVLFLHREPDVTAVVASGLPRPVIYLQSASLRTGDVLDIGTTRTRLATVRAAFGAPGPRCSSGSGSAGRTRSGVCCRPARTASSLAPRSWTPPPAVPPQWGRSWPGCGPP